MRTKTPALMFDMVHTSYKSPTSNVYKGVVDDPHYFHGHGSSIVERVRPGILWGETESVSDNPTRFNLYDTNDIWGADLLYPWGFVRLVSDRGVLWVILFFHVEEGVEPGAN